MTKVIGYKAMLEFIKNLPVRRCYLPTFHNIWINIILKAQKITINVLTAGISDDVNLKIVLIDLEAKEIIKSIDMSIDSGQRKDHEEDCILDNGKKCSITVLASRFKTEVREIFMGGDVTTPNMSPIEGDIHFIEGFNFDVDAEIYEYEASNPIIKKVNFTFESERMKGIYYWKKNNDTPSNNNAPPVRMGYDKNMSISFIYNGQRYACILEYDQNSDSWKLDLNQPNILSPMLIL